MAKPYASGHPSLWHRQVASFSYAFRGIWAALRYESHLQFHAAATAVVIGAGLYFRLSPTDWALLALAVAGVWTAELVNTAIETLTDLVSPEFHPLAGKAKDVAAGAVLLAGFGAVAVGGCVFGPKIWALLPH